MVGEQQNNPIIFTAESVQAILAGRKIETRRIIKGNPKWDEAPTFCEDGLWKGRYLTGGDNPGVEVMEIRCPYGKPGDILRVHEKWQLCKTWNEYGKDWHDYVDGKLPNELPFNHYILYAATDEQLYPKSNGWKWRSPIFMKKWASRIILQVKEIRVERVQDIDERGIIREGLSTRLREHDACVDLRHKFADHWDSINAKRGFPWLSNSWVWVIRYDIKDVRKRDAR
jgi:hypothetical protein